MKKFLRYTVGLMAFRKGEDKPAKLVKIAAYELSSGEILLQAESARNLSTMPGSCRISAERYQQLREMDGDDIDYARELMALCGWEA